MLPQWIGEGLPFQCTGCGKCCTGAPGCIWVNEEEIQAIAAKLGLPQEVFRARYTEQVDDRVSLIEQPHRNNDCIFLKGKECGIYDVRPTQCRTFPFWPSNVADRQSWEMTAAECEGIRPDAPLVPREKIEAELTLTREKSAVQ